MTTTEDLTEDATLEAAAEAIWAGGGFALMAANRWNGTDLHAQSGATLRITREDPEGSYWIGTLSRNGICGKSADVSGGVSSAALASIARVLWNER